MLPRENPTAEVGATRTATIGTLVVRLRTANSLRYGAPLEVMRPHLAAKLDFQLRQHFHQEHGDVDCSVLHMPVSGFSEATRHQVRGQQHTKRSPFAIVTIMSFLQLFGDVRKDLAVSTPVMVSRGSIIFPLASLGTGRWDYGIVSFSRKGHRIIGFLHVDCSLLHLLRWLPTRGWHNQPVITL